MNGILGTNASLSADLTLLAYVLVLAPGMLLGYFFARRKMFMPHHKMVMTTIVIINWVLIIALMLVSYRNYVAPALAEGNTDIRNLLPLAHMITGGIAQILATYLVLLMWTENTPFSRIVIYRIKKIKGLMRLTLSLWLATILLGVAIYVTWYTPATAIADEIPPISTEEPGPEATESNEEAPVATEEAESDDDDKPASTEEASSGY